MAQYMGILQGRRGEVTRLGDKKSGLRVVANGWDSGVKVNARTETDDNGNLIDVFVIEATGGSNAASPSRTIAIIRNGVVENRMPQPVTPAYCPDCGTKMDTFNTFIGFAHGLDGIHCRSCLAEPIGDTNIPIVNNAITPGRHCPTCGKGTDESNIPLNNYQNCLYCIT